MRAVDGVSGITADVGVLFHETKADSISPIKERHQRRPSRSREREGGVLVQGPVRPRPTSERTGGNAGLP